MPKLRKPIEQHAEVAAARALLGKLAGRDERRSLPDDAGILDRHSFPIEYEPGESLAAAKGAEVEMETTGWLRSHDRSQLLTAGRKPERSPRNSLELLIARRDHQSKDTDVMAGETERNRAAHRLFAPLAPAYDRYARLLSLGQDPRWRRYLVSQVRVPAEATVLDVATGTGAVALEVVQRYGCRVVGIDQSHEMLEEARARIDRAGLASQIELLHGRAEELPFRDGRFTAATFTYLLRYVEEPLAAMREVARVVRPGGTVGSLEFGVPSSAVTRAAWNAYTRIGLPALGRLISPGWHEVGRFLNPSIQSFSKRWPLERQVELWRCAGLVDVQTRPLSFGGGVVMWARRDS